MEKYLDRFFEQLTAYDLTGLMIFFFLVAITLPLMWVSLNKTPKRVTSLEEAILKSSEDQIKALKDEFKTLRLSLNANKKTDDEIIDSCADKIGFSSVNKMNFIKSVAKTEDIYNPLRHDSIKYKIMRYLKTSLRGYCDELNRYMFSNGVLAGKWLWENYPMKKLTERMFQILFEKTDKSKSDDVHDKVNDIQVLILNMEEDLWEKKIDELNNHD